MSELTPEQQADRDLMLSHLRQAVEHGYSMATPGNGMFGDAVREAFPDLFASPAEVGRVRTNDDLETDDYSLISRAEGGYWISTWSWVPSMEEAS